MPDRDRYDDWADKLFDADCWCDTKKPYTCKACFARQTIAAALRKAADEAREECAAYVAEQGRRITDMHPSKRVNGDEIAAELLRVTAAAIRATIGGK